MLVIPNEKVIRYNLTRLYDNLIIKIRLQYSANNKKIYNETLKLLF